MISFLLNCTVKVQRRASNPSRNVLNEPDYGAEASFTTIYASMPCRIDYVKSPIQFLASGERSAPSTSTVIFFDPEYDLKDEDRITFLTADDTNLLSSYFIVTSASPVWDAMGNKSHNVAQIDIH